MELDKEKINQVGNNYPGGWSEYYNDYCENTGFYFEKEKAKPFYKIGIYPYTNEMIWVEGMMYKELLSKSMEWVEDYFVYNSLFPKKMGFQVLIEDGVLQVPSKEKLVFIYEDSTGYRTNTELFKINEWVLFETYKPYCGASIFIYVPLLDNLEWITWFSLMILYKGAFGRVECKWVFEK